MSQIWDSYTSAVYIIADRHGRVCYVGSVARRSFGALRARLREHLRTRPRASRWATVMVIPLRASTAVKGVRRVEGRVGKVLMPTETYRLPPVPQSARRRSARPA